MRLAKPLQRVVAQLDALAFAGVDAEPLAAFRWLFGLFLLAYFGSYAPDVTLVFSSEGVYSPYLLPDLAPGPIGAWILYAAWIGCAMALTIGWRARLMAGATLLLFLHHYFLYLAEKHSSFDRLIALCLLVLCCVDSGARWSWRTWRSEIPMDARQVPVGALRIIRFQLIVLYLGAGLWKAAHPGWHSGIILQTTFQSAWATEAAFAIARAIPTEAWRVLSWGVISFELGLAAALTWPRTRRLGIVAGSAFHLGNWALLSIPEFLVCITVYPVFMEAPALRRAAAILHAPLVARRAFAWIRSRSPSLR